MLLQPDDDYHGVVDTLVLALRVVLVVVFATAGIAKLRDREGSIQALKGFGVGGTTGRIGGTVLPLVELAVAVALVFASTATAGAIGAMVLLLAFVAAISRALLQGTAPDCHCFGQIHSAPAGPSTLARNALLAAMAVVVLAAGGGPAIDTWVGDRTGSELLGAGLGLLTLIAAAVALWLFLDNRKLRRELADAQAGYPVYGLPVGARAPEFSLRSIDGRKVTLESLTALGRPVALVFVGPNCGSCWILMPHLSRWQASLADRLELVMISTGTSRENEEAIAEHGIAGTFLHDGAKLLDAYRVPGTPTAVILSPEGRIISTTVVGSRAVEPLVRLMLHGSATNGRAPSGVVATPAAA
jgi:methylamine dehydrogenase accessory protein MauD